MKRVFTFGESMGLVQGSEINSFANLYEARISSAGSEGNVAVGLSRLGLDCTWYSRLGEDSVGDRVQKDLLGEGVAVVVKRDKKTHTGLMLKTSPRNGVTSVSYYRAGSAASHICPEDFDGINFSEYHLVHLTGITPALSKSCKDAAEYVATKARASGCLVSFDVNFRSKLWSMEEAAPVLRSLASKCNILIAGVEEAELVTGLTGKNVLTLASELMKLGPTIVLIKQGEVGATLFQNGKQKFEPSIKVSVIDTVGAGDAFSAAFIGSYLLENDSEKALSKAVIAGGLACTHPGDWQGFPSQSELSTSTSQDPVSR